MILSACLAALLSAQSADTATSVALLRRPGYVEANPFLPSSAGGIVGVKAAFTTGAAVYGWRIRKRHPKLAAVVFVAGAAAGTVGAWHNARVYQRRGR